MKRFGEGWNTNVEFETCPTPVGWRCMFCHIPIQNGDLGVVMPYCYGAPQEPKVAEVAEHRDCMLYTMGIGPLVQVTEHKEDCQVYQIERHNRVCTCGVEQLVN